ncbi:RHS repeat domain-containing protein [Desulfonema magnum]|uniref:YD repeat-containing protein n=1 Tax=Desulfonema magnum TaxID=45655 RepID=A0A975BIE7_9BACT|nr:RHS repeat domain-containing protein [Desulfonema magnum]QTA85971.1 YD repeat-containing protein [Desulfonema magnum]
MRGKNLIFPMLFFLITAFAVLPLHAAIYTYDGLNRLRSVTYEEGHSVRYQYDADGNIISIQYLTGDELRNVILALKMLAGMGKDGINYDDSDANGDKKNRLG